MNTNPEQTLSWDWLQGCFTDGVLDENKAYQVLDRFEEAIEPGAGDDSFPVVRNALLCLASLDSDEFDGSGYKGAAFDLCEGINLFMIAWHGGGTRILEFSSLLKEVQFRPAPSLGMEYLSSEGGEGAKRVYQALCLAYGYDPGLDGQEEAGITSRSLYENIDDPEAKAFVSAYLDAIWALTGNVDPDASLDSEGFTIDAMDISTMRGVITDCEAFYHRNKHLIDRRADVVGAERASHAGHDFFLTRNGHGAGFWDGDWPKAEGETLTSAAEAFGPTYFYVGDDGRIYQGGREPGQVMQNAAGHRP